jgi:hypothetical protein
MTADDPLGDELLEKLSSGYDITEGIPPTASTPARHALPGF